MCLSRIPHGFWRKGRSVNNSAAEEGILQAIKKHQRRRTRKTGPERRGNFPAAAVCLKKPGEKKFAATKNGNANAKKHLLRIAFLSIR